MPLIRRIARPLLASTFIVGGLDALRHPDEKAPKAENVNLVEKVVEKVAGIDNTQQVVAIDAGVKVGAGILLALGWFPRIASTALAASLVPTTLAGHRFWEEEDPAKRSQQQLHFLKNASMLGGLILAAVDTEGKPSLAWRAKRAPKAVKRSAADVRRESQLAIHQATNAVKDVLPG